MKRIIFIIGGIFFLILGLIGLILPVIPQVPFLMLSLLLFARGSRLVHEKLIQSRLFAKKICPVIEKSPLLSMLLEDK